MYKSEFIKKMTKLGVDTKALEELKIGNRTYKKGVLIILHTKKDKITEAIIRYTKYKTEIVIGGIFDQYPEQQQLLSLAEYLS